MATEYAGSVEAIRATFGDRQYWLARLADSGADEATLDQLRVSDDGTIVVASTQVLHANRLPALVAQFHHGDLRIQREERWHPVRSGRADGTVKGTIPGAPVALHGSATLAPAGAGSQLAVTTTVEVRVPLVGGKIETFIGTQLANLLTAEQRFTTAWIDRNGRPAS